jgi:hypothetical protein
MMSCQEICEEVRTKFCVSVTRQAIWGFLKNRRGTRSQAESMKIRAITGRMDYEKVKRKIDYRKRRIDYSKLREARLKKTPGKRTKLVTLNKEDAQAIRQFAKENKLTIGDALKFKHFPNGTEYTKFALR